MPIGYATLGQVVRRQLYRDLVAWQYFDEILPHLAREMSQDFVPLADLNLKCRVGQRIYDRSLNRDHIFFWNNHTSIVTVSLNSITDFRYRSDERDQ